MIGFIKTDPNRTRIEIHFIALTLKLHSSTTQHMAKDGQVCFHKRLLADPVNTRKYTTEPVKPLDGTNKGVSGAKLQLKTTSVYPVDCACFYLLIYTHAVM